MTKQPEALRLADLIDPLLCNEMSFHDFADAAVELRRLHEVNVELLEALKWIAEHDFSAADETVIVMMAWVIKSKAEAAISKATRETE